MNWRGTSPSPVREHLLAWDGEAQVLLFDPRSGDTHLLSALAGLLLEALDGRTLNAAQLASLATAAGAGGPELPGHLHEHLTRLTRLGLLEEAPA